MVAAFFSLLISMLLLMNQKQAYKELPSKVSGHKKITRILCYNIRNGRGLDNEVRLDRIVGVINKNRPHVVALQELDSATERSNGVDVLGQLAQQTGMHASYGAAIHYKGGKYGVGVLSEEKPLNAYVIPLPGTEEKRALLVVELPDLVLFCSHFSLTEKDRQASVEIIRNELRKYKKKVVLAGDLNDLPSSSTISALKKDWALLSGNNPTFPANNPDRCIDYIFGSAQSAMKVKRAAVIEEPVASDHRPLFVDIE